MHLPYIHHVGFGNSALCLLPSCIQTNNSIRGISRRGPIVVVIPTYGYMAKAEMAIAMLTSKILAETENPMAVES